MTPVHVLGVAEKFVLFVYFCPVLQTSYYQVFIIIVLVSSVQFLAQKYTIQKEIQILFEFKKFTLQALIYYSNSYHHQFLIGNILTINNLLTMIMGRASFHAGLKLPYLAMLLSTSASCH
jgi:hypothetical protein